MEAGYVISRLLRASAPGLSRRVKASPGIHAGAARRSKLTLNHNRAAVFTIGFGWVIIDQFPRYAEAVQHPAALRDAEHYRQRRRC
jgi:hypothetical protein